MGLGMTIGFCSSVSGLLSFGDASDEPPGVRAAGVVALDASAAASTSTRSAGCCCVLGAAVVGVVADAEEAAEDASMGSAVVLVGSVVVNARDIREWLAKANASAEQPFEWHISDY